MIKKILLGTTAFVAFAASSASAHPLQVMLGGSIDSQVGMTDQHDGYDTLGSVSSAGSAPTGGLKTHKTNIYNTGEVHVSVKHKGEHGMLYGGFAGLQTHASYDDENPAKGHRTYLWMENKLGRFEFGSNYGVDATMKVDATSIARATGGIDGDWWRYANLSTGIQTNMIATVSGGVVSNPMVNLSSNSYVPSYMYNITPNFITTSASRILTEDARKISWYSPRHMGVQVGLSYTPDAGQFGSTSKALNLAGSACCDMYVPTAVGTEYYDVENLITFGANYLGKIDNLNFKLSALANWGQPENKGSSLGTTYRKLNEYQLGASVAFDNFHLAGSYMNSAKSLNVKNNGLDGASMWTAGASYVRGAVGTSLTYMKSSVNSNKFSNTSLGVDYQWQRGLMPYAEVSFFKFHPSMAGRLLTNNEENLGSVSKNEGAVFILGTELSF